MSDRPPPVPRLVVDTNVIFSRVLHELIGRLAREARLFDLVWSDELLAETKRALMTEKPVSEPVAERWIGYLRDAFPDGRVDIADAPADVDLTALTRDPGDEHVCALAIAAGADLLVTFDDGFDRPALAKLGVDVAHPDALLAAAFDDQPTACLSILERQASAWGARPLPDLLDALERAGATTFACKARCAMTHSVREP